MGISMRGKQAVESTEIEEFVTKNRGLKVLGFYHFEIFLEHFSEQVGM